MEQLRQFCQSHGAKPILLVQPTPYSEAAVREMTFASHKAGVEAMVPIDPAALSTKYYQIDEMRLNSEEAALFTTAFATFLPQRVYRDTVGSPN